MKKILCGLLAIIMLMSFSVSANSYTDVPVTTESIEVLNDLGIMKGTGDNKFEPDAYLTKAEGVTLIIRLLGLEEAAISATGTKVDFTDVPADHWATGYISVAISNGIVAGMGDGTFCPDDEMTYAQFIKMLVAALGYNPQAEEAGEWPTNYLTTAKQIKLNTGFTHKANDSIKRIDIAKLAYNALTIPKMGKNGVGINAVYAPVDTLILDDLGLAKVKGSISVGTERVTVVGKSCVAEDGKYKEIIADILSLEYDDMKELKAYENVPCVIFYDVEDEKIVSIVEDKKVSSVLITSNEIKSFEDNKLTIYTDVNQTKTTKIKIDENLTGVKNVYDELTPDYIQEQTQLEENISIAEYAFDTNADYTIELKDTNADDVYDFVSVTEYVYDVVKEVSVNRDGTVITIKGLEINYRFDTEDEDVETEFVNVALEDIKEGDILNIVISESEGLNKATIIVAGETINATVKYYDSAEGIVVMEDGSEYICEEKLEPRTEATFYISFDYKVIAMDTENVVSAYKYGFATYMTLIGKVNEFKSGSVRFVGTDGKWVTADLKTSVIINGKRIKLKGIDVDTIGYTDYVGTTSRSETEIVLNSMISYKTNSEGYIHTIVIGADNIATATEGRAESFTNKSYKVYDDEDNTLGKYTITDNTVIFSIPEEIEDTRAIDEEDIKVITSAILDEDLPYSGWAYNVSDKDVVSVLCGSGFVPAIDWTTPFFVVEKVLKTTNDEDEDIYLVKGFQNGETAEFEVLAEDYVILNQGDVINITGDEYTIFYNVEDNTQEDIDTPRDIVLLPYLTVAERKNSRIVISKDVTYVIDKNAIITVYEDNEASEGSLSDIREDDVVIGRADEDGRIYELIVIPAE